MRDLLHQVKEKERRGKLDPDTVAGRLLCIRDPATGRPLPDDVLVPQIGIIFVAGGVPRRHPGPSFVTVEGCVCSLRARVGVWVCLLGTRIV
jgi:hypothetical protein